MLYQEARKAIETGDTIAVRTSHGILGDLTKSITSSAYTHVGAAIWVAGRLYMAELNGGRNHLVPLSQLTDFDVYARPAGISVEAAEEAILFWLTESIPYGFLTFVAIGFLNCFRIKMFVHWRKSMVCSGFVVAIYERAGWPERSRVISPQELVDQLVLRFPSISA